VIVVEATGAAILTSTTSGAAGAHE